MSEVGALVLQIVVIISVIVFFIALIANYIYKKAKGIPTGDCAECHKGSKKLLQEYHKLYPKK